MTIDDLRNPNRKSGFDRVSRAGGKGAGHGGGKPWCAAFETGVNANGKSGVLKRGPRRATPEEAAQDYCDYANGLGLATPTTLNYPNHPVRPKVVVDSEVADALGVLRDARAQQAGRQGYVYCIQEVLDNTYVKIGYSVNPEARVGELQTGNPRVLELFASMPGTLEDERRIHAKYIKDNIVGEWFHTSAALLEEFAGHYEWQKRKAKK